MKGRTDSSASNNSSSESSPEEPTELPVARKNSVNSWLSRRKSPSPSFALASDPDLNSLCFFFNNYVNLPREANTNMYISQILPIYNQSPENSALRLATAATAANLAQLWQLHGPDTDLARIKYGKALAALRISFDHPETLKTEQILGTMFMLDFYENLNRRYQHGTDANVHQRAAMALVASRGKETFQSEASRRLFTALRARYIHYSLQTKRKIELDKSLLQEDPVLDLPGVKLDLILADLANFLYDSRQLFETGAIPIVINPHAVTHAAEASTTADLPPIPHEHTTEYLLSALLEINLRLNSWHQSLPASWSPYRIPNASETLHHSIRAVGLYNGLCDVYSFTGTASSHNGWRTSKILVLQLISHALKHLSPSSSAHNFMSQSSIDEEIQKHVDDICASVPFFLGSRTTLSFPHEHQEYPPIPTHLREATSYIDPSGNPTVMSDKDHIRTAAAVGGFLMLTPLVAIMRYARPIPANAIINKAVKLEPIKLRPGQLEWVLEQVRRVHKIYQIPMQLPPGPGTPGWMGAGQESHIPIASAGASAKMNFSAAVAMGGWHGEQRTDRIANGNGVGRPVANALGFGTRMDTDDSGISWSGPLSSTSGSGDEVTSFGESMSFAEQEPEFAQYQAVLDEYQPAVLSRGN
jgi:hypothetical protein